MESARTTNAVGTGTPDTTSLKYWLSIGTLVTIMLGILLLAMPSPATADFSAPPIDQYNASANRAAIVGTWSGDGFYSAIQYLPDGTVRAIKNGLQITGRYWFIDDTHVRMSGLEGIGYLPGVYEIAVYPDHFVVSILGINSTFKRIN